MIVGLTVSRLSRGGSEKQLMQLARGLSIKGHDVAVYCYGGESDLDGEIAGSVASFQTGDGRSWVERIGKFSSWIDDVRPDIVHAFMKRASTLAVLARRRRHRCAILASDFSTATYRPNSIVLRASLVAFRHADGVVTQTELNRRNLERLAPSLRGRLHVVRNGLDIDRFTPSIKVNDSKEFRLGAVGTVSRIKNPQSLIRAVALVRDLTEKPFSVEWVGRLGYAGDQKPSNEYVTAMALVKGLGLEKHFMFLGERSDVASHYRAWDALIHPSIQEGFPNVVAEGMACGLPILVGDISDLPQVVSLARNGFIFEPNSPQSIAQSILAMMETPRADRVAMGQRSVRISHEWFSMGRFIDEYEALYERLVAKRR